jgi:hypothetical protein
VPSYNVQKIKLGTRVPKSQGEIKGKTSAHPFPLKILLPEKPPSDKCRAKQELKKLFIEETILQISYTMCKFFRARISHFLTSPILTQRRRDAEGHFVPLRPCASALKLATLKNGLSIASWTKNLHIACFL